MELVYEPFNLETTRYNFNYKFDHWFEHVPTSGKRSEIEKEFDQYIPNNFIQYPAKICRETRYSLKTPLIFARYLLLSSNRPRYLLKDPIALLSAGWMYERYDLKSGLYDSESNEYRGIQKKRLKRGKTGLRTK